MNQKEHSVGQLLDCLSGAKGLQELANVGAKLLGTPVLFADPRSLQLAFSEGYPVEDLRHRFRYHKDGPPGELEIYFHAPFREALGKNPFILHLPSAGRRYLVCKAFWGDRYLGFVSLPEEKKSLETVDYGLLVKLADTYALTCVTQHDTSVIDSINPSGFILTDLLDGLVSQNGLQARLTNSCLLEGAFHRVLELRFPAAVADEQFLRVLIAKLQPAAENAWFSLYQGHLVLLAQGEELCAGLQEQLLGLAEVYGAQVGISDPDSTLLGIPEQYRQAKKALYMADLLGRSDPLQYYDNVKVADLLSSLPANVRKRYCSRALHSILSYDKENGTVYGETLYAYLQNDADLGKTAKALFVHRNTILYRFRKIEELFHIHLQSLEELLQLYISFRLLAPKEKGADPASKG